MLTSRSRRPPCSATCARDPLRRVGVGQVDREVGRLAGQRLGERPQALLAAGDEDQLRARLAREPPRGRLADATRGAGDQRRDGDSHSWRERYSNSRKCGRLFDSTYCRTRERDPRDYSTSSCASPPPRATRRPPRSVWREEASFASLSSRRHRLLGRPDRRGAPLLAVVGHIDEIGLVVTPHRREGLPLVRADRRLGPADPGRPAGRGAAAEDGPVLGVVGRKPIHLLERRGSARRSSS